MRKTIALVVSTAFLFGTTGFGVAQTPTPGKMSLEQLKEACLKKAGTDEAKKASCEKKYADAQKAGKAKSAPEKKEEKK